MRGNVIGFDADTNTGAISGHDGKRYEFATVDWHERRTPARGDSVDFAPSGEQATQIYLVEPQYVPPTFGQFLFSVRGRISRSQFWLKWVLPVEAITLVLIIALVVAIGTGNNASFDVVLFILVILSLVTLWPTVVVLVKRMHDRNKSGWLALLFFAPVVLGDISGLSAGEDSPATVILSLISLGIGIWFFVEFGCMRGTIGANRFGPDPVVGR
jgi:uncharacterized membrane protein YhaH (DUF805 family)